MSRRFGLDAPPPLAPSWATVTDGRGFVGPGLRDGPDGAFVIPGTDITVNTGQPKGILDQALSWVKANPLPAVGIAVVAGYLLRRR